MTPEMKKRMEELAEEISTEEAVNLFLALPPEVQKLIIGLGTILEMIKFITGMTDEDCFRVAEEISRP